jgi:hypothetical protein
MGVLFRNAIALRLCKFVERHRGGFCLKTGVYRSVTKDKTIYFKQIERSREPVAVFRCPEDNFS